MKKNNENLTKEDYNFIHTQKVMFLMDIIIGVIIIFVSANLAMLFTNDAFLSGILPIALGMSYTIPALSRRYRKVRAYWEDH